MAGELYATIEPDKPLGRRPYRLIVPAHLETPVSCRFSSSVDIEKGTGVSVGKNTFGCVPDLRRRHAADLSSAVSSPAASC